MIVFSPTGSSCPSFLVPKLPRSQTPVWERTFEKLRFSPLISVTGAIRRFAKQSFGKVRSQTEFRNEERRKQPLGNEESRAP